jgi:DNA gyrase subunit A
MILPKSARDTIGVQIMTLKGKASIENAYIVTDEMVEDVKKYYVKSVPAAGSLAKDIKDPDQLSF